MKTIPQNDELLKELIQLLRVHRSSFKQERVYQRVALLVIAEVVVLARHTVTQLLMSVGWTERDWSAWYRLFSRGRFVYEAVSAVLFGQTLKHVGSDALYVLAGDSTQTRRSSRKMEGAHWLYNPQSPVFKRGIHIAQRWFNGSWLLPAENGYSRAVPLRWLPAFTEKSQPRGVAPCKEWEAACAFLRWVRQQLVAHGRTAQRVLMVADGHFDTINLWKELPEGVTLMARSAKNRVLWQLPAATARSNCKYARALRHQPTSGASGAAGVRCSCRCAAARAICRSRCKGRSCAKAPRTVLSSLSSCAARITNAHGVHPCPFWSMLYRMLLVAGSYRCL
jgi:hypothetical protein